MANDILSRLRRLKSTEKNGRGKNRKNKSKRKTNSIYSLVPISDITPAGLEIWKKLPKEIRQDPSLASYREEHERLGGGELDDLDPSDLNDSGPEDDPFSEEQLQSSSRVESTEKKSDFLAINVISEASKPLNGHKNAQFSTHDGEAGDTAGADETDHETNVMSPRKKLKPWMRYTKIGILLACWCVFTVLLLTKGEKVIQTKQISVPVSHTRSFIIMERPTHPQIALSLKGAFLTDLASNLTDNYLDVWIEILDIGENIHPNNISTYLKEYEIAFLQNISTMWRLPVVPEDKLDMATEITHRKIFELNNVPISMLPQSIIRVNLLSNMKTNLPLTIGYDLSPVNVQEGVLYAAVVLLSLYVLIIFEIVNRTLASILASTMSLGILAALNARPTMAELMSWIDVETLLLLFSMMVLVAIFSETGVFDYLAVYAYKITAGKIWPLINCLCLFTAVMSSFLDNVTTVLLMTPVTIRLCEVMELNPVPILMSMIIYSNIGGALTPVGDPPNVIIASNSYVIKNGVNFTTFTLHMAIGVVLVMISTYFQLRLKFRHINDLRYTEPKEIQDLRLEIAAWQRTKASLSSYSKDEGFIREQMDMKIKLLLKILKRKSTTSGSSTNENYKETLEQMQVKYPIRKKPLLIKSAVTLVFVITFFFLHSVPQLQKLSLGWTALLGAILLLILADRDDLEGVLAKVEWSTLLFFAALFVLMEALSKLGLINWIGSQTEAVILSVSEESRLAVAVLLILWVSAIASAFVDNIPLTTMMVKIAISLAENEALGLPLQPLIWALAFGACLGGNGTLIGASANVVCAGVAEQHGYRFTFVEYFKVGFPIMIGSVIVATFYLMVSHVLFQWH